MSRLQRCTLLRKGRWRQGGDLVTGTEATRDFIGVTVTTTRDEDDINADAFGEATGAGDFGLKGAATGETKGVATVTDPLSFVIFICKVSDFKKFDTNSRLQGGSTITDFQSQSGARIQLSRNNEFFPGTTDRIIMVSCAINEVLRDVELILSKLLSELNITATGFEGLCT
ncbi:hypothetical protein RYX36_022006 [Vicia faba]